MATRNVILYDKDGNQLAPATTFEQVRGIYNLTAPLVAETQYQMTESRRVYVYTGNEDGWNYGHWYYRKGSTWTDGGVYQAYAVQTDDTLTMENVAADAKAVGNIVLFQPTDVELISAFQQSNSFDMYNYLTPIMDFYTEEEIIKLEFSTLTTTYVNDSDLSIYAVSITKPSVVTYADREVWAVSANLVNFTATIDQKGTYQGSAYQRITIDTDIPAGSFVMIRGGRNRKLSLNTTTNPAYLDFLNRFNPIVDFYVNLGSNEAPVSTGDPNLSASGHAPIALYMYLAHSTAKITYRKGTEQTIKEYVVSLEQRVAALESAINNA